MIRVIATIEVAKGRRDDFLAVLRELVPKVLAEEGCVEYGPWVDVPTNISAQPAARDNVVTMVEKWQSIQALETHLMASHMLEFRQTTAPMRVGVTLRILEPA
jgi:quinol monooxygenase YgiN